MEGYKFIVMDIVINGLGEEDVALIGVFDTAELAHEYIDAYEKDLGIICSGMYIESVKNNPKYK